MTYLAHRQYTFTHTEEKKHHVEAEHYLHHIINSCWLISEAWLHHDGFLSIDPMVIW